MGYTTLKKTHPFSIKVQLLIRYMEENGITVEIAQDPKQGLVFRDSWNDLVSIKTIDGENIESLPMGYDYKLLLADEDGRPLETGD